MIVILDGMVVIFQLFIVYDVAILSQVIAYHVPSPLERYLNLFLKVMQEQGNIMLCIFSAPVWWAFCNVREAEELGEFQFLLSCRHCDLPVGHCTIQRVEPPCAGLLQAKHWCWLDRKPG
jgi:hypothetical protein